MGFPLKSKHLIFLLVAVLLLTSPSCKSKQGNHLEFETKTFKKYYQGCDPEAGLCAYVEMKYPEFTKGAKKPTLDKINVEVGKILSIVVPPGKPHTPEVYADELFKDYKEFREELPNLPIGWSVEKEVKAEQPFPKVLTLEMSEYNFLGGAHPNSFVKYININSQTGEPYRLEDLFQPGYQQRLNEIAEKIFRETYEISPEQKIEDTVYTFEGGQFRLNDNFLITPEGLTFLFNQYEIAPYGMGSLEVIIPYESLQEMLKKGWPPPRFKQ